MALLRRDTGGEARKTWLLLFFGSTLTGCALFSVFSAKERPFGFNHAIHQKEGLECGDCHFAFDSEEFPGFPPKGGCDLCHEEIDAEKPPERRIDVLFEGETYKTQRVTRLSDELKFSHLQHVLKLRSQDVACSACHVGIESNEYVTKDLGLTMKECQDCHSQRDVPADCATCHQRLDVDVAPDSHLFMWLKVHGPTVRAHEKGTVNDCGICHDEESSCKTCHAAMEPDSHDNFFRHRGHGLHARMDRQSCAVCHRADSCDTCHQETRPRNHTGSFAGTLNTHCLNCHLPVQKSECFVCHKGSPSHALAPPKPADHTPGMDCRQCHGAGQPLPHVDNGSDCNACHF